MEAAGTPATMEPAALSPPPHDESITSIPVAKQPTALTPPTSEEMNHNADHDNSSDLSDLDLDDEDEEDITPDHYYDGGRVPVFKPTMDQFRSFKKFIDKIDKYGMKSGIVKVIPPKEWRDSLPALDDMVKTIKIKNPITQDFMGTHGTYTQQNMEKQRSYNLPEWKSLTEETQHQPPAKRGERRRNQEKVVRGGGNVRARPAAQTTDVGEPKPKRKPGRPRRNPLPVEDPGMRVPPTPVSPSSKAEKPDGEDSEHDPSPVKTKPKAKPRGRQPKSENKTVSSRRMNNRTEAAEVVDEAAFKNFDYHMDHLDEFTTERCKELETHYWKSLSYNQPMYAADMPGSLFTDSTSSWNVAKLENLLDVLGTKVPGVNTAYLYMGMWKATFAWHLEDVDLYSINYIHFGAPKQWYSISQEDARCFEAAMRKVWPNDSKHCDQFLRHKTYLISPALLESQYNIKVNKLVHHEGEFVITYPYGYHSGYNLGYNCAESVNFATEGWLDYGRIAKKCDCEADSVWVDVTDIERKLRGEPTPEYYEETDDSDDELDDDEGGNLPSPPASVKGKTQTKKRKREPNAKDAQKKKKKIRIRIKGPTREPCVLCPNDIGYDPLLPTDNGRKAHRSCALYTPETWIVVENGKEKIYGVTGIDRARLDLKCNFCRSKRGACFQCSSKKCTRAFHATCAPPAGVQIDAGMVPTFGEDGTEYFEEGYDFRCRYHRPKMPKNLNVDSLENSKLINNYAKALQVGDLVQVQYPLGEVFAGTVVELRSSELTVVVDVLPEGDRVEVEWKWLCVLDPDDSQRPKPSSSAVAMPEGMNKKSVSIENRQDGMPVIDQPFNDNPEYKWQEFINIDMPPNGYAIAKFRTPTKLRVDLEKPDQLYFYISKSSTDARCYFTDIPGGKEHIAKSNFLDRVKPAPGCQNPAVRQSLAASYPTARPIQQAPPIMPVPQNFSSKPYTYKPKIPAAPNMVSIDQRALAAQRNFAADAGRRASHEWIQPAQMKREGSDSSHQATPPRAFPPEQYYSAKKLPAAVHGEYSQVMKRLRRDSDSQHASGQPFVPNYQSVLSQQKAQKQPVSQHHVYEPQQFSAPPVPMMGSQGLPSRSGSATGLPNHHLHEHHPSRSRPTSSSNGEGQGHVNTRPSPQMIPPSPAMTASSAQSATRPSQQSPPTNIAYLESVKKYPYLADSFLRRDRTYESPYPICGGFSAAYQPIPRPKSSGSNTAEKSTLNGHHTPSASLDSASSQSRTWTPPSQKHEPKFLAHQTPPPQPAQFSARKYPDPHYQTPQEFQQQMWAQQQNSVASRDGGYQRMVRDQMASIPYPPPQGYAIGPPQNVDHRRQSMTSAHHIYQIPPTHTQNSFGHSYDSHQFWQGHTPKAPTPSPLLDANTLGMHYGGTPPYTSNSAWSSLPRGAETAPMGGPHVHHLSNGGYGPPMPQMPVAQAPKAPHVGGHETWRYTTN